MVSSSNLPGDGSCHHSANPFTVSFGWGKESPDRLKFSWETIATANELKADYDYKTAIDTSKVAK